MPGSSLFLRSCMAAEIRRGTLERVPRTPQNFPERIIIAVTRRSCPVPRASLPIEHYLPAHIPRRAGTAAGVPGAKPPAKLTYSLPLPAGKGVGGIGAEKQAKGKADRQPPGQAPRKKSSPPPLTSGRKCDIISKPSGRERANASRTAGSKTFLKKVLKTS